MKPSGKQIEQLRGELCAAREAKSLSYAELSRLANVDPAQVHRILGGQFKTFSNNVMLICRALNVRLPQKIPRDTERRQWSKAFANVQRLLVLSGDDGAALTRLLGALADLQEASRGTVPEAASQKASHQTESR